MQQQQQIINVWSCTSAICEFIFYISNYSDYFLVTEKIRGTENFARPSNSQNNKLSYQRVDIVEFSSFLCFIVLLILLPTPILLCLTYQNECLYRGGMIWLIYLYIRHGIPIPLWADLTESLTKTTKVLESEKEADWCFVLGQGSIQIESCSWFSILSMISSKLFQQHHVVGRV